MRRNQDSGFRIQGSDDYRNTGMTGLERKFVLWALGYTAICGVAFVSAIACPEPDSAVKVLLPFHFLAMAQSFLALSLTVSDLYKRPFASPNSKLTWLLLILLTGGVWWIVYVLRHAITPRADTTVSAGPD